MKKLLFVLLLSSLLLVGCGGNNDPKTTVGDSVLVEGKLIIGISPDYPPFESYDTGGNIVGFDVDVINAAIKHFNTKNDLDLTVEFKVMDFDLIVTSLQQKQVDIGLSGFTYDAKRDVTFSESYLDSKQVVVVRKDSDIKTLDDLVNKTIGAGLGTTGANAAAEIEGTNVISPGDYNYVFTALEAGQIDAVVCDEAVADNYVNAKGFVKLEKALVDETMHMIINKDNTLLSDAINQAIKDLKETPEYQDILNKWGM